MSKTVSELAQELGLSKQYLNRILSQNNLGRKKGNKKLVSDIDEKALISILDGNIGNKKSETKKLVSDIPLISSEIREDGAIGNKKMETEMETSFRYVREQLEIKGKEVERLHQLLDQSQQLLLSEQKKSQLLIENQAPKTDIPHEWQEKQEVLENQINYYRNSANNANQRVREYQNWAERAEKGFWFAAILAGIFFVLLLVLGWIYLTK